MGRYTNPTKTATVSLYTHGSKIFVGIKARKALGLEYNDEIRVTFKQSGISVKGELDSSNTITVSTKLIDAVKPECEETNHEGTLHTKATVEKTGNSWYDGRDLDEERYNLAPNTLEASH